MDGYEMLLTVMPTKNKSKYPFSIMDEIEVTKTRKNIDIEFVKASQTYKKFDKNRVCRCSGGCR